MHRFALAAACALVFCSSASAAPFHGVGGRPCSEFTVAAQIAAPGKFKIRELAGVEYNSVNNAFNEWALGYVSGLRASDPTKEPRKMSGAELDQALRAYCAAHPAEPFVNAVTDLAKREGIGRK